MNHSFWPAFAFAFTLGALLLGYPVALTLGGSALILAALGSLTGNFDAAFLQAFPERLYGIMTNETLIAIPLFVFMGVMLERSRLADELLEAMGQLCRRLPGGLGISVCLVGGLMAASTGIVGATVVTMGLISLPAMLKNRYSPSLASGIVCASGTLGQIIPPSIVLIILGDVMSAANQQAQLARGDYSGSTVSVGDLFVGALIPGILLMLLYMGWVFLLAFLRPEQAPPSSTNSDRSSLDLKKLTRVLLPPIFLILGVLGSILAGVATPTEAASVGSVGAIALAQWRRRLSSKTLHEVLSSTLQINAMVFLILIGASVFSLVFRGFGGDLWVEEVLQGFGGSVTMAFLIVMAFMFFLGFFLDFFEITFVVIPIVGPILLQQGLHPVWLGVMFALNLQTSFLTPPFGFSLFYLRGVAPPEVSTQHIYRGALPFIAIQLCVLTLLWFFPGIVTWLPSQVFGTL